MNSKLKWNFTTGVLKIVKDAFYRKWNTNRVLAHTFLYGIQIMHKFSRSTRWGRRDTWWYNKAGIAASGWALKKKAGDKDARAASSRTLRLITQAERILMQRVVLGGRWERYSGQISRRAPIKESVIITNTLRGAHLRVGNFNMGQVPGSEISAPRRERRECRTGICARAFFLFYNLKLMLDLVLPLRGERK